LRPTNQLFGGLNKKPARIVRASPAALKAGINKPPNTHSLSTCQAGGGEILAALCEDKKDKVGRQYKATSGQSNERKLDLSLFSPYT